MKFQGILTVEAAMAAVTRSGDALRYVKDQTEAVVMAAVTRSGDALQYVLCKDLFIKIAGIFKISIEI
jgi:hypothetical protein